IAALHELRGPDAHAPQLSPASQPAELPEEAIQMIIRSDTMLIATVHPKRGADSSHRGGRPGFVRIVDKDKIVWPDYEGKGMYQTLGNALVHPNVGLTFVDFEGSSNGRVL